MKKGTGLMLIISALVLILIIIVVKSYSSLTVTKEEVINKESDINVQLSRKKEQVSNLISISRELISEEELINEIEKVNEVLIKEGIKEKSNNNKQLSTLLNQFFEKHKTEVISNEKLLASLDEILSTEKRFINAQTNYNKAVDDYNSNVNGFPSSIIASIRGFKEKPTFDISIEIKDIRDSEV